jgi:hypothetical protein
MLVQTARQSLLQQFARAFTRPGHRRFVEWVTAMALNVEEHTITQSVVAIEQTADWKAMESFAEYGAWWADYVVSSTGVVSIALSVSPFIARNGSEPPVAGIAEPLSVHIRILL